MIDTLSMLALKVAPNIFDISSQLVHVSMRDQIVRGRLLVRDLKRSTLKCDRILIVGAGIAGISAAAAAAALGIEVLVVDTNPAPMALQASVASRWVGPFMYEWPSIHSGNQDYPPSDSSLWDVPDHDTPTWSRTDPVPSSVLSADVRAWLTAYLAAVWKAPRKKPKFLMNVDASFVSNYVKNVFYPAGTNAVMFSGSPWPLGDHKPKSFDPDYILLAAGMGIEDIRLTPGGFMGVPFWSNDDLKSPAVQTQKTAVFGGGDGALQDVFRSLTIFEHPLSLMSQLQTGASGKALQELIPGLTVIEQQSRLQGIWTMERNQWALLDNKCADFAQQLALEPDAVGKIAAAIRPGGGRVHLFIRGDNFSKAYLLNRFVIHLIEQAMKVAPHAFGGKMTLKILRNVTATKSSTLPTKEISVHTRHSGKKPHVRRFERFDRVVVRFGIVEGTVPGLQMVSLTTSPPGQRTSLAQVPLPFVA